MSIEDRDYYQQDRARRERFLTHPNETPAAPPTSAPRPVLHASGWQVKSTAVMEPSPVPRRKLQSAGQRTRPWAWFVFGALAAEAVRYGCERWLG